MTNLESKRLPLILDLDHTLLHTIKSDRLVYSSSLDNIKDLHKFYIEGDSEYYVKFRPGIVKFLDRISQLYDIHIYTMGTRDYAQAIIQIIVTKLMNGVSVFNGKIVTRTDTGKDVKLITSILPGTEHLSLILDDSPSVWKAYKNHVVPIYPYKFFVNVDKETFTVNPENEENLIPLNHNHPEREQILCSPNDNHLRSMYHVLASVHNHFFKNPQLDIKENLKWRRSKVLYGTHILFSGVFPLRTDPKTQSPWKKAEYFGAKCYEEFNHKITHLVAVREGTDKVMEAIRRGNVYIITLNWLYDSVAHWVKMPEVEFDLIRKYNCTVKLA